MTNVTPDPDAPLDIEALPDFWDARRLRQGKADKSTCAAELRLALERARCICGSTEKRCPVHGVIAVEEGVGTPNPFKRYYGGANVGPYVETCQACGAKAKPPHSCPYREEICGDFSKICTCCAECQSRCAQDI